MLKKVKDRWEEFWFDFTHYSTIYDVYRQIRDFPARVKILIDYIPVLWNNQEWDQSWFMELMIFKLKRMEKFFRGNTAWAMNAHYYANEIKFTIECLEEIDGVHLTEMHRQHAKKYGDLKMWSTPCKNSELSQLHFKYAKCTSQKMDDEATEKMHEIYKLQYQMEKDNLEMGMDIIKERINYWWD